MVIDENVKRHAMAGHEMHHKCKTDDRIKLFKRNDVIVYYALDFNRLVGWLLGV